VQHRPAVKRGAGGQVLVLRLRVPPMPMQGAAGQASAELVS
jgi:hypothetical protein